MVQREEEGERKRGKKTMGKGKRMIGNDKKKTKEKGRIKGRDRRECMEKEEKRKRCTER